MSTGLDRRSPRPAATIIVARPALPGLEILLLQRPRAARQALLANQTSFSRMAERMKLDFSAAGIVYFARWITPMNLALRFDTRFFLLAADEQIGPVSLSPEHDAALWTTRAASVGEKEARSLASGDPGYDEIS